MKKITFLLCLLTVLVFTTATARSLREAVAVVRPVYEESTVQFLSKFGSQLKRDGFYSAAEILDGYSKGIFGSGFAYHDTEADRVIVVTNRHVVHHARTVDVEFTVGDNTPLKYSGCRVLAVDDEQDLAFVLLPERALGECATVQLHTQAVADGDVLFSAATLLWQESRRGNWGKG